MSSLCSFAESTIDSSRWKLSPCSQAFLGFRDKFCCSWTGTLDILICHEFKPNKCNCKVNIPVPWSIWHIDLGTEKRDSETRGTSTFVTERKGQFFSSSLSSDRVFSELESFNWVGYLTGLVVKRLKYVSFSPRKFLGKMNPFWLIFLRLKPQPPPSNWVGYLTGESIRDLFIPKRRRSLI